MNNKKMIKILKLMLVMIGAFTIFRNEVKAVNKDDIVINYWYGLYGGNYLPGNNSTAFKVSYKVYKDYSTSGSGVVKEVFYCAEQTKGIPGDTEGMENRWVYSKQADNSKELAYVIENGYHGQSLKETDYLTGDLYADYFITQTVVWAYTIHTDSINEIIQNGTYKGASNDVSQKIQKLYNDAKTNKKNPSITLSLENNNQSFTMTSDKKYYISKPITVTAKDISANITLSLSGLTGAFLTTDTSATSGTTSVSSGSKVYIKVPVSNMSSGATISVSAKASATIGYVSIYDYCLSSHTDIQKMARYGTDTVEVSQILSLTTEPTIPIVFSKTDIAGSKEIPGAQLNITQNGSQIYSWTSTNEARSFNLAPGTYILTETISPAGYIKATSSITFVVNNNGTVTVDGQVVTKVVMKNEPIKVLFNKADITGQIELEGAKLKITDKDKKDVYDVTTNEKLEWTSEKGKNKEFHLKAGDYILTETYSPDGYIKNTESISFTVKEDGTVTSTTENAVSTVIIDKKNIPKITMTNSPITLTISKTDITGEKELPGAHLKITDKKGNIATDYNGKKLEWISAKEPVKFHLKKGTYILIETIAPEGYEVSEEKIEFTIDETGKILIDEKEVNDNKIIFKNQPITEQVQTGNEILYITLAVGIIALGISTYLVLKNNKKK